MTDYTNLIERLRAGIAATNDAADAIEALQGENERLREMCAGLKKMIYDGSIHERTQSIVIELERRNAELQAKLDAAPKALEPLPEIDYELLIAVCFKQTKFQQGTKGCVAFAKGAEWYRSIAVASHGITKGTP